MKKYSKTYNVILDNMDIYNYKLRPISAIMYIQDAFARLCATKKVAAYDMFPKNMYWVVTEFNIEFIDELPFWSEEIGVNIWISEISKLKIYTDYEITYKGKTIAEGNALWFLISTETKHPVKAEFLKELLEIQNEYTLGEHKKTTFFDVSEKYNEITHIINLSDLDFNKHVNNKSYINIAEMTAPDEFKQNNTVKKLSIKFYRETFLGNSLTCETFKTNKEKTYIHKITKDDALICEIQTSWEEKTDNVTILESNLDVKNE